MTEKRYPQFDEEEGIGIACEPAVAYAFEEPTLGLPQTEAEAISSVIASEEEFERGEGMPWDSVMQEIRQRYAAYAY